MAITHCDTKQMQDIANDITNLANEYEQKITQMFNRLANVPYETKEWIGNQSEKYFKTILFEKQSFIELGENIKKYSKMISDYVSEIEQTTKSVSEIESR